VTRSKADIGESRATSSQTDTNYQHLVLDDSIVALLGTLPIHGRLVPCAIAHNTDELGAVLRIAHSKAAIAG
jgi:hypothetical protein